MLQNDIMISNSLQIMKQTSVYLKAVKQYYSCCTSDLKLASNLETDPCLFECRRTLLGSEHLISGSMQILEQVRSTLSIAACS
mmetsp:Transcript_160334/g.307688  ORF Transcript_160334/g.307688 Transcript_160334/m.307688 type:complete len:83 (-) Transcript_160334:879-1127(-)